jgi:hypothetical protein
MVNADIHDSTSRVQDDTRSYPGRPFQRQAPSPPKTTEPHPKYQPDFNSSAYNEDLHR